MFVLISIGRACIANKDRHWKPLPNGSGYGEFVSNGRNSLWTVWTCGIILVDYLNSVITIACCCLVFFGLLVLVRKCLDEIVYCLQK